jgi:hypothetical protein
MLGVAVALLFVPAKQTRRQRLTCPIRYAVICCGGVPLAYLDDGRGRGGGPLTVTAPAGAGQIVG